jgi:hypothetical protein
MVLVGAGYVLAGWPSRASKPTTAFLNGENRVRRTVMRL